MPFPSTRMRLAEQNICDHGYRIDSLQGQLDRLKADLSRAEKTIDEQRKFIGMITDHLGLNLCYHLAKWTLDKKGGPENPNHEC